MSESEIFPRHLYDIMPCKDFEVISNIVKSVILSFKTIIGAGKLPRVLKKITK